MDTTNGVKQILYAKRDDDISAYMGVINDEKQEVEVTIYTRKYPFGKVLTKEDFEYKMRVMQYLFGIGDMDVSPCNKELFDETVKMIKAKATENRREK